MVMYQDQDAGRSDNTKIENSCLELCKGSNILQEDLLTLRQHLVE